MARASQVGCASATNVGDVVTTILLVEDDAAMVALLERYLTGEGYHVVAATSGAGALAAALVAERPVGWTGAGTHGYLELSATLTVIVA